MEVTAQVLGGRYELDEPLGSGGMAVVWRARDSVLGRFVAVKLLAGRHAGSPGARQRIRAEARAAAILSHPNIAQVYDYGEWDDAGSLLPYVVMELVRGVTLQQRQDAGPLSARFAMRVSAEVAAALAAAHAEGLVHRDIKPANVMVTPDGAKVVDFGIAAAISPSGADDPDGEVLGTPAYLAPERLMDNAVEPASDVYALGVLLYRLLSGESPWSADTTTQMLNAHVYIDPAPLAPVRGVPDYVIDLCNRCLSKDPTLRPSAREAAALLARGAGLRVVEDEGAPAGTTAVWALDGEPSVLIRKARGNGDAPHAAEAGQGDRATDTRGSHRARHDAGGGSGAGAGGWILGAASAGAAGGLTATGASGAVLRSSAPGTDRTAPSAGTAQPPGGDFLSTSAPGTDGATSTSGTAQTADDATPDGTLLRPSAPPHEAPSHEAPSHEAPAAENAETGSAAGRPPSDSTGTRSATDPPTPAGGPGAAATAPGGHAAGPRGSTTGPQTRTARAAGQRARRRRRLWTITGAFALVALVALAWILLPGGRPDREPAAAAPAGDAPAVARTSAGAATSAATVPPVPGEPPAPGAVIGGEQPRAGEVEQPDGGAVVEGNGAPGATPGATEPTGAPTTTPNEPEPTTEAPEPQERTFTSTGGTVRATCPSPDTAQLLSWTATKPYKVQDVNAGPAATALVVYKHGNRQVRMTVTCNGGVPSSGS